tara:strand:+ start:295 stop:1932 length:1638 start_codon:yes stop_codon:yes gene_type:complete
MDFFKKAIKNIGDFIVLISKKISSGISLIFRMFSNMFGKLDNVFERIIEKSIKSVSTKPKKQKKKSLKEKIKSTFNWGLLSGLIFLTYIVTMTLFIVPVGSSAVILQFGKYNRQVESGINIRFPFVERYFIVNTGNIMEETFGFLQVEDPLNKPLWMSQEDHDKVVQYQKSIEAYEAEHGNFFSTKGNLRQELNKSQRQTHDRLRKVLPPIPPAIGEIPLEEQIDNKIDLIQSDQEYKENIMEQGVSLNGRIPVESEGKFITADLSIIRLKWAIQYKITNAKHYLFKSRDAVMNLRDVSVALMSRYMGKVYFDEILKSKRHNVESLIYNELQQVLSKNKLGLSVTQVIIIDALPVPSVIEAFNEVNKASQDHEKTIYSAQKDYLNSIPEAKGEAEEIVSQAKANAKEIIERAEGESRQFSRIVEAYKEAPEATKDFLYLETMNRIFSKVPNTIIDKNLDNIIPIFSTPVNELAQKELAKKGGEEETNHHQDHLEEKNIKTIKKQSSTQHEVNIEVSKEPGHQNIESHQNHSINHGSHNQQNLHVP